MINVLPAEREVGEYLVTHPGVDKVAFTGSTAAGRRLGALCGELLRPVTLELGGKSAAILLEDAPLPLFLDHLLGLSFNNNGQTCTNNTRPPAAPFALRRDRGRRHRDGRGLDGR
ncbi:NAD/NADP-dependent betaine aldehyde dehydrogenase [Streptomyces hirsutus]